MLVLDFDLPKSLDRDAAAAAVERDVERAVELLRRCGARWVVDRSPLGGMHIYVPLAQGEWVSRRWLRPLLDRLKSELRCLDLSPMLNATRGCITVPGSPTKHGGYRQLVGATLEEAIDAFTVRSRPGLIGRLNGAIDPQAFLSTRTVGGTGSAGDLAEFVVSDPHQILEEAVGPGIEDRLPASVTTCSRLPKWVPEFCATGAFPGYRDPSGRDWTPSHAREAVLFHHAARGWSLAKIKATAGDPTWEAFWSAYRNRSDRAHRLATDWRRAFEHARTIRERAAGKSSTSAHKLTTHTGGTGVGAASWYKLAAARKWVLTGNVFHNAQRYTALAVVSALAYAQELTGEGSVGMGIRWLSDAAGCSEDSVVTVLKKFREAETAGSPVERTAMWQVVESRSGDYKVRGDGYRLVDARIEGARVKVSEWEARMARPSRIAPVWRSLGLSAWWVHTVLSAVQFDVAGSMRRTELAAAARVSVSTIDRAVAILSEHGLVTAGHGWVTATDRGAYEIPELSAAAAADREVRLDRQRRERAEFQDFLALIEANYSRREIIGYESEYDLTADHEDYMQSVAPGSEPPLPPIPDPEDAAALDLLADILGASEINPEVPAVPQLVGAAGGAVAGPAPHDVVSVGRNAQTPERRDWGAGGSKSRTRIYVPNGFV